MLLATGYLKGFQFNDNWIYRREEGKKLYIESFIGATNECELE